MKYSRLLKELDLLPAWVAHDHRPEIPIPQPPPRVPPPPPAAPPPAPKPPPTTNTAAMNWTQLQKAAQDCRLCELHKSRQQIAFGVGDTQAQLMLIGEAPGREEDRQGIPFVGAAGQLLDKMLFAIGLNRQTVYIANMVKCRPPDNRTPTVNEAHACLPYLKRQIALVKPQLLVALGKVAATHLLQTETPIGQLRQKIREVDNIPIVVTYHPAYLLRNPLEKRKAWDDLRMIRRLLDKTD